MAVLTQNNLPIGYRFSPTDEELVNHYLKRKILGEDSEVEAIGEVDVCKLEPWDLPALSVIRNDDPEWFFFCPRDQKYPKGRRSNRATKNGYWKATGKDRTIKSRTSGKKLIGMKKTLVFHIGRAPGGQRTGWIMHEYHMSPSEETEAHRGEYMGISDGLETQFQALSPLNVKMPAGEELSYVDPALASEFGNTHKKMLVKDGEQDLNDDGEQDLNDDGDYFNYDQFCQIPSAVENDPDCGCTSVRHQSGESVFEDSSDTGYQVLQAQGASSLELPMQNALEIIPVVMFGQNDSLSRTIPVDAGVAEMLVEQSPRRIRLQGILSRKASFKGRESSCNARSQGADPTVLESTGDSNEISHELKTKLRSRPRLKCDAVDSDQQDSSLTPNVPSVRPWSYSLRRYMIFVALILILGVFFVGAWRSLAT